MKARLFRAAALTALEEPFVSLLAKSRPDAGLDRQVAAVLELQRRMKLPPLESMEPARARRFAEEGLSPLEVDLVAMAQTIDTRVGGVPAKIFVPDGANGNWLVYFHGGGGVIGSARSSERITRLIAEQTKCTVASIDYRLGPEHKHPAAIDDALAAWDAICARVPAGKIAVGGDSFGAMLAICVDRNARYATGTSARRAPDAQLLVYPITDFTMTSPGFETHGVGYLYTRAMAAYFKGHYLHDSDDRKAASPAYWPEVDRAAPAVVVTAGFDPLRPEGDAHAARLRTAGGRVVHRQYPSLVHGFLSLAGGVRAARAAVDEMCGDLVEILAS